MVVKNFVLVESCVGTKVGGRKIVFSAVFDPTWTATFWTQRA